jgi:hypothetical protein
MADGIAYRNQFKDKYNVDWRIDFLKDGHTGAVTEMKPSEDPLMIEFLSDSDDFNEAFHPSHANIGVISESNFQYKGLLASTDFDYKVNIFQGANLITAWANNTTGDPYETLTISTLDFDAVNSSGNGGVNSNLFSLTSGDKVYIYFKCVKNSGSLPTLSLTNEAWTIESKVDVISEGWNFAELTASWTGTSRLIFWSTASVDYEITEIFCVKKSKLYWTGWVIADNYEEPYDTPPYNINIKCTDGLDLLGDYIYKYTNSTTDDTYYTGRRLESQIVLDILGKIDATEFKEFVNLYENSMQTGTGDSPLDQIKIDVDVFRDMYCDEALTYILNKYGASIRQWGGVFTIYRPVELASSTVYGRYFTDSITKTSVSISADQYIDRTGTASNLIQVRGGSSMPKSPVKKINIFQDYSYKESWIKNYQLKAIYEAGSIYWAPSSPPLVTFSIPSITRGIILGCEQIIGNVDAYVFQQFGTYGKTTSNDFTLTFDYLTYNTGAVTTGMIRIRIKADNSNNYLYNYDELESKWNSSADFIDVDIDIPAGVSGWTTWETRILDGLPADGPYTITLYEGYTPDSSDVVIALDNIKFNETTTNLTVMRAKKIGFFEYWTSGFHGKKWFEHVHWDERIAKFKKYLGEEAQEVVFREYTKLNSLNGREKDFKFHLGDIEDTSIAGVLEQFTGALAVVERDTLAEAAAAFVTDHAADYTDITVTSSDEDIVMTGKSTVNADFTGSTTITNSSGNLSGTVVNTQAFIAGTNKIQYLYPGGTNGTITVHCTGVVDKTMTWDTDSSTTCDNFITDNTGAYSAAGITITKHDAGGGSYAVKFEGFSDFAVTVDPATGDMTGDVDDIQAYVACTVRIDTITLTGLTGAANILCDGVTEEVAITEAVSYSTVWNSRGGSEATELIDLIGDEIKDQYSRCKDFNQVMIKEDNSQGDETTLNLLGNVQDSLNTYGGNNRILVPIAGEFNVKPRDWNLDLCEII